MLRRFGSARAALEMVPQLARRGERSKTVTPVARADAEAEFAAMHRLGARLVCWGEPTYPSGLAAIEDAPPILTVLGQAELLTGPIVAVVGARNASANGRRFRRDLAAALGQGGIVVVSGLARGIDAAAHLGALETGSVAVVAGGVDVVYPEENRGLHEALARQGAIVAELPLGTEPQARHFPRRNSDHFRDGSRSGGGRGGGSLRFVDHCPIRTGARPRRLRSPRLPARSALPRLQRFAATWRDPDRERRGRAVAARAAVEAPGTDLASAAPPASRIRLAAGHG